MRSKLQDWRKQMFVSVIQLSVHLILLIPLQIPILMWILSSHLIHF